MRLNDLFEGFEATKLTPNAEAVLPPVAIFPELNNSNSYQQYRFTTYLASARAVENGEVSFKKIVPWEQFLAVVGYTPQEIETVKLAAKQAGMEMEMFNHTPSHEPDWVNKTSPVMPFHMSESKSTKNYTNLLEDSTQQILVIYPGRFQPVHLGHSTIFKKLQEQYGANVFMATSDKTEPDRSPFDYNDKAVMARAAGIPSDKFVQVKNPYSPTEITKLYDPNNTVLLMVVGEKDMQDDPRFKFASKKDGSPSYLQKLKDLATAEPMSKHGYIVTAPTVEFDILGNPVTSATQVRNLYTKSDAGTRSRILKDLFGNDSAEIRHLFDTKLLQTSDNIMESTDSSSILEYMREFLEIAKNELNLDKLPTIIWTKDSTAHGKRPTFGKFENADNSITISIVNRHPIDIMRTLAHELTHYKQNITKGLDASSGDTGSPEEDQANALAGRIMRHFDEQYPNAFKIKPLVSEHIVKHGSRYRLLSKKSGKNLGDFPTKAAAEKHEREIQYFKHATESVDEEAVWDKPNPVKTHKKLSAADKAAAKRRAKAAGRKYPNMVDNIWAARR